MQIWSKVCVCVCVLIYFICMCLCVYVFFGFIYLCCRRYRRAFRACSLIRWSGWMVVVDLTFRSIDWTWLWGDLMNWIILTKYSK